MSPTDSQPQLSVEKSLKLLDLIDIALQVQSFEEFAEIVLPVFSRILGSSSVLIYTFDSHLPSPFFITHGIQPEAAFEIENLCAEQLDQLSRQTDVQHVSVSTSPAWEMDANFILYYFRTKDNGNVLIGLTAYNEAAVVSADHLKKLLCVIANTVNRLLKQIIIEKKLSHLDLYMSVSSMLTQSTDLNGLMETILYCCLEAVSAEAGSILLLDDEKKYLYFYQVEGISKPLLMDKIFPADKGLAGSVLHTQKSEVVNDVHNDPRFYKEFDTETGFKTKNMIAIPLVVKKEPVGVLEILNKTEGPFTEDDHFLLLSLADEIAFAVRNAKIFEYVVNSYCKMRQGQRSCEGCKRPLGAWTPCIEYRKTSMTFPRSPKKP